MTLSRSLVFFRKVLLSAKLIKIGGLCGKNEFSWKLRSNPRLQLYAWRKKRRRKKMFEELSLAANIVIYVFIALYCIVAILLAVAIIAAAGSQRISDEQGGPVISAVVAGAIWPITLTVVWVSSARWFESQATGFVLFGLLIAVFVACGVSNLFVPS